MVILVTGKKNSGKTTYSERLAKELREDGHDVEFIDAHVHRKGKAYENDFSDEGRRRNLLEAAELASTFERQGKIVILAFIAPYKHLRNEMRYLWIESRVVYMPGGELWEGTRYERPDDEELQMSYIDDLSDI